MKRLAIVAACLAVPHTAIAATIIWAAGGLVSETHQFGPLPPPPRETRWSLELQFDPDRSVHTPFWPADAPCSMTPIAGAFTLGGAGYTFGGGSNLAFTNSILPADNCSFNPIYGTVQFFMFPTGTDDPWNLLGHAGFLLASYDDLFQDGVIPTEPRYSYPGYLIYRNNSFEFSGAFSPQVVQQPAPIPEPATTTLVTIGLALIGARRWRSQQTRTD